MNNYITGAAIRALREKNRLTQQQLAEKLCVSDKAISKWETGKGFPDISLIEPLANVLQVSIPELLSGEQIINTNRSANILKSNLYVCPICGNIFHSTGSAMISRVPDGLQNFSAVRSYSMCIPGWRSTQCLIHYIFATVVPYRPA